MLNGHRDPKFFPSCTKTQTTTMYTLHHGIAKYVIEINMPTILDIHAIYIEYMIDIYG